MSWLNIKAKAGSKPDPNTHDAEILVYDDIGFWGVNARDVIAQIQQSGARRPLVRINSMGGGVFEAGAIATILSSLDTTIQIDGVAASAASLIAMAGKRVHISETGFMMLHAPWGVAVGTASDMRDTADSLQTVETSYEKAYAKRTGKSVEDVRKWLAKDTWFDAEQAVAAKLADKVTEAIAFSASANLSNFADVPEALRQRVAAQSQPQKPHSMNKLLTALAQAGLISSAGLAEDAAVAELNTNITAIKRQVAEAQASLAAQTKANATALVDAAVADGRIKPDLKDKWVASIVANADAANLLASIEKPKPATGATPMAQGTGATEQPKTITEKAVAARKAAGLPV